MGVSRGDGDCGPARAEAAGSGRLVPVGGRAVTELGRAVRDSKYTTFGGLDSAHIAATEMLFREQIEEQVRLSHQLQCFNMTT